MLEGSSITAVLGPTNTGKTHRAVERMLAYESGMIGLPLRLLAREIYDRLTARVGESRVALVTGEEKRVPRRPAYWVSTVEAMPMDLRAVFVLYELEELTVPEIASLLDLPSGTAASRLGLLDHIRRLTRLHAIFGQHREQQCRRKLKIRLQPRLLAALRQLHLRDEFPRPLPM